jgi:hypothetical protein
VAYTEVIYAVLFNAEVGQTSAFYEISKLQAVFETDARKGDVQSRPVPMTGASSAKNGT